MSFFPRDFIFHRSNNEDQDHQGGMMFLKRSMSFSEVNLHHGFDEEDRLLNQEDELSDDCVGGGSVGDKKKRLKREQVRELERSFELGNKLDAERKQQLAKSLSLQPRQVAIWFQNRRARWKTKQLEKDYNSLKKQFASAMVDNDNQTSLSHRMTASVNLDTKSATMPHTLETSLRSDPQPSRINQVMPEDESLCSILGSMDDQTPGLWTWAEQQHFGQ